MNRGTGDRDLTGSSHMASTPPPRQHGRRQSGWGREQGPDSHKSHRQSLPQLGHGCPLLAAPLPGTATGNLQYTARPCPPTLPGPLATAQLQGADHQESSLPRTVQPLLASVSLPSSDLLYKQGVSPAPAEGWHIPFTTTTTTHPAMGPTVFLRHQGPVSAAGTGSDCSGQDMPRCPALALLQPPV